MADMIKRELGIEAELQEGDRGVFTVRVNDKVVAKKSWLRFPQMEKVLLAVRQELGAVDRCAAGPD